MSEEKFYYVEGNTPVSDIVKSLTDEITKNAGIYNWEKIFPNDDNITDISIIKATTSYGASFYLKIKRPTKAELNENDQMLLKKAERCEPLTYEQLQLLAKEQENLALNTNEIYYIKKEESDLTESDSKNLNDILKLKNITDMQELMLLRKKYRGESLSDDEYNLLESYKKKHSLTIEQNTKVQQIKLEKMITPRIATLLVKEFLKIELNQSEENELMYYRQRLNLSPEEENKLLQIKASQNVLNHVVMQIGTKLNGESNDLDEKSSNVPVRFAWYKVLNDNIGEWLPVQYWINVTKDVVNIVLRGDPSADNYPYNNYLTSYAYIGALKPMEDSAYTDDKYNFGITVSSDVQPSFEKKFGERTATGITDVCMIANKIGMPMQPHYPGFYTTHSFMDKCNTEGSRWNHKKHQFSDITLVHPIDMERGKMINVLCGDASAIYDMDKLVYKKDTEDEEYYKKFKITAPYNFLNNSANNLYAIAIKCYKTAE